MAIQTESMEDVIRKVKKCLALANDGKDDESDTAMLLVQKMMAKHNLSMNDVDLVGEQPIVNKNVIQDDGTEYTKLQWWQKRLATIISDNFRCYNFIRHFNRKTKVVFLGLEEDVEICKAVYKFATVAIKFHADNYIKSRGIGGDRGTTVAVKNDYIVGYLQGLKDKFAEQVNREDWGLVLVKDALVIKEYDNLKLGKGRASTSRTKGDAEARAKGYNDGQKFSHGNKAIRGR